MDSYGRRIAIFLRQELEHQDIEISRKSSLTVFGEYEFDLTIGKIVMSIKMEDQQGNVVGILRLPGVSPSALQTEVEGTTELMLVANASIAVGSDDKPHETLQKIIRDRDTEDSNLTVEGGYLVLEELGLAMRLREVDPQVESSNPNFLGAAVNAARTSESHFTLTEGRSYAVELKNLRTDIDFACKVLFDGIDTFVLCDDTEKKTDFGGGGRRVPKYQYWIVNRGRTTLVPGWYKNLNKVNAFQIVPDAESVAYQLGAPQGIGSVQVVVTAAWPKGEKVDNKYKDPFNARGFKPRGGGGEGASIQVNLKPAEMETGVVLGALSAEYTAE